MAVNKVNASKLKVLFLSFMAGCFLSVGLQVLINVTAPVAGVAASPPVVLLGAAAFAVWLLAIVILGAELFTGNCMMLMAAFEGHVTYPAVALECGWAAFSSSC